MRWGKLLSTLDSMSPTYGFTVEGNERVRTNLGGCFVILNFVVLFAYVGFSLYGYFKRSEYELLQYSYNKTPKFGSFDILESELMPYLMVYDEEGTPLNSTEVTKYFTIQYQLQSSRPGLLNLTTSFVDCKELLKTDSKYRGLFGNIDEISAFLEDALCIPREKITKFMIEGSINAKKKSNYGTATLSIYPCDETKMPDDSDCLATLDNIESLSYMIGYLSPSYEMGNYSTPAQYQLDFDDPEILNSDLIKEVKQKVTKTTLIDNLGVPYSLQKRFEVAEISNDETNFRLRDRQQVSCEGITSDCLPYVKITLRSSPVVTEIVRRYKAITEVLGSIGGLKEIIFLFFTYLYLFSGSSQYKRYMVRRVFGITPDTQGCLCCKKAKKKSATLEKDEKGFLLVPQATVDAAYDNILQNIDICNISRLINLLRFFAISVLKDYQVALAPLAILNQLDKKELRNKSKEQEKKKKGKDTNPTSPTGDSGNQHRKDQSPMHASPSIDAKEDDDLLPHDQKFDFDASLKDFMKIYKPMNHSAQKSEKTSFSREANYLEAIEVVPLHQTSQAINKEEALAKLIDLKLAKYLQGSPFIYKELVPTPLLQTYELTPMKFPPTMIDDIPDENRITNSKQIHDNFKI